MAELKWTRWPVENMLNRISGRFGANYGGYLHRGLDVAVPTGTPVYAPAAGWVVSFANDGSFGVGVCLDHSGTLWYSLYAHLSRAVVNVGDRVVGGQLIGFSGNTGMSTGPHLHWQVCRKDTFPRDINLSIDPLAFDLEEDVTPEQVQEIATKVANDRIDDATGIVMLGLFEQGLGIRPSTFDPVNQARFDAIVEKLLERVP